MLRRFLPLAPLAAAALLSACTEFIRFPKGEPLDLTICYDAAYDRNGSPGSFFVFEDRRPTARVRAVSSYDGCDVILDAWEKQSNPKGYKIGLKVPPRQYDFLVFTVNAVDSDEWDGSIIARGVYENLKPGSEGYLKYLDEKRVADKERRELEEQAAEARLELRKLLGQADDELSRGHVKKAYELYQEGNERAKSTGDLENTRGARVGMIRCATKLGMKLPEGVREHVVKSQYILKQGGSPTDAASEMAQAVQAAPWWLDGYFNLGMMRALEKSYALAVNDLKIYVEAAPQGARAQAAQDKIYELEVASKQSEKLKNLPGHWVGPSGKAYDITLVDGGIRGVRDDGIILTAALNGNRLEGSMQSQSYKGSDECTIPAQNQAVTGTVDLDNGVIEFDYNWNEFQTHGHPEFNGTPWPLNCLLCVTVCDNVSVASTTNHHARLVRR